MAYPVETPSVSRASEWLGLKLKSRLGRGGSLLVIYSFFLKSRTV